MAAARLWAEQGYDLAQAEDFRLGTVQVRPSKLQIRTAGHTQTVERRVMQMLVALYAADGATVTKQQLIESCWDGLAVSDDAITQCVSKLRRALARGTHVKVTSVPRVGYCLDTTQTHDTAPAALFTRLGRRQLVAGGTAVVAAAGLGGWLWSGRLSAAGNSIAVLPFANLGGDPAQDYFCDGVAEEVRTALGRIGGLEVAGRTSSESLRHTDAATVARRLHVSNVLTGSVRRSPMRVRIAAQLIDGRTGFQLWSQTYDLAPGDPLELQRVIAESVALALRVALGRADRAALAAGGTRSPMANDLYLQAKLEFRLSDTEATYRKVIALCDAAIGIDPQYAEAFGLKGMAWDAIGGSFATDAGATHFAYEQGEEAGRRAIAFAPRVPDGYVALARSMSGQLNIRGALQQYQEADAVTRSDPGILCWWVQTLAEIGRTAEALALSNRLIARDPLNPAVFARKAFAHYFARQYELAISSARKALSLAPALTEQQSLIGDCLNLLRRYPEALAQYARAPALDPYCLTGQGLLAARTNVRSKAARIISVMKRDFGDQMSFQVAQIYAQLGMRDEAFNALEIGRRVLDPGLNSLPADPFIDPLRADRRLTNLLHSLGFA